MQVCLLPSVISKKLIYIKNDYCNSMLHFESSARTNILAPPSVRIPIMCIIFVDFKSKPSNKYQLSKKLISDHSSCCDAFQTPPRMRDISGAHRSAALSVRATCESGIQYLKEMMSEVPIRRTRRGGKVNTTRRKSQRTFSPLIICCDIPCTKL